MDAEVIVVGGGVIGLWTANNLVTEGVKTILFDQFPLPHTRGSSHGQSRITRSAYPIDEFSALMSESLEKWRELEEASGKNLLVNSPLLVLFDMDENAKDFNDLLFNMEKYQTNHEVLSLEKLRERYPGIKYKSGMQGIYDGGAGILKSENCLQALRDWFTSRGGILHDCEEVFFLDPISDSEVEVTTQKQKYRSNSVVLACGPYINKILSTVGIEIPVKTTKIPVFYWKDKNAPNYSVRKNFPAIIFCCGDIYFSSVPSLEYPGLMKICYHTTELQVDPESRDSILPTVKEKEKQMLKYLQREIIKYFPDIDAASPAIEEVGMFTVSPDNNFILDFHPKHKNIVIGSGFSGHGFKASPSVGHILANMAFGLQSPYPSDFFSLERFNRQVIPLRCTPP